MFDVYRRRLIQLVLDFTTDSFPTDAIINLKAQNPNFRLGVRANFTCKISSFNLFRTFQFTLEFQNGSSTNNEGVAVMELVRHRFTAEQWFSTVVTANLTKISCSAPLRTTGNWLSASLSSTDFFRDNSPEDTPDVEVNAESPYNQLLAVAGLVAIITGLTSIAIFVVQKYTKHKVLHINSCCFLRHSFILNVLRSC